MKELVIVGGGIAGLTTAVALQRKGYETTLFENAPTIRAVGAGLALAANAMKALKKMGIDQGVIERGQLLSAMTVKDSNGKTIARTDSRETSKKYGIDNFVIHRADLHSYLLSQLDQKIVTNKHATGFSKQGDRIIIHFSDGTSHETDALVAADGINSNIRRQLVPSAKVRYAGYTCWRAVVDATSMSIGESSESWGPKSRFGIVPLSKNKIYWFACVNAPQDSEVFKNYTVKDLKKLFAGYHEPVQSILNLTKDEDLIWGDIIDLKPIDQFAFDNVVLIGDAAHATTPNLGQGACQAIEDAVVLADEIAGSENFKVAFKNFERRRIRRTHDIVNKSWALGKIAQVNNQTLASIRNFIFRLVPDRINDKQLANLYTVDFE